MFTTTTRKKTRTRLQSRRGNQGAKPRRIPPAGARVSSFPPVAQADARILILGSMPGRESLRLGQYYAHPRNAFWRILGALTGAHPQLPYGERLARLTSNGIALWDVLHSCSRDGSLDSAIVESSIIANDFASFYAAHPQIRRVFFNGAKAQSAYMRHVQPRLPASCAALGYARLPSTSPAHAGLSVEKKLQEWRRLILLSPPAGRGGISFFTG